MARISFEPRRRGGDLVKAWLESQGLESAFLERDKTTGIAPGADWEKKMLYREVEQLVPTVLDHEDLSVLDIERPPP
jgi:hypothetical protein